MWRRSRACAVFIFIIHLRHSGTKLQLWDCAGMWRRFRACAVLIFSFHGCPWLLLAVPGCFWLLLAAPGCSWVLLAARRCSWLLVAASGCSWLPLAAIDFYRSEENYLFGVLRWVIPSSISISVSPSICIGFHISILAFVSVSVLV
jgi:hypothetical protein